MSKPRGDGYVIGFAVVVCLACSLLLAGASSALKKPQEFNKEIDRKTNVLKAFGVPIRDEHGRRLKPDAVRQYFTDHIAETNVAGPAGESLPLYIWRENGEAAKYAFPISGKGLWSTIKGYLALEKDLSTIAGVTFYEHGETPGLGGECEADWFQNNFKGKKVFAHSQRLRFEVVKGKVADKYPQGSDHAVDGMSGATLTGNGITRFINAGLDKYESYFSVLRKG
jgi:Na+-transporting NADH:ubiquinone oxidoreductase subunit C